MSQNSKLRTIGAKRAPEPLSMDALAKFAQSVIRTDKEAALRAQNDVGDLASASNDQEMTGPQATKTRPRVSQLTELCQKPGGVKMKSRDSEDETNPESPKLIAFKASKAPK